MTTNSKSTFKVNIIRQSGLPVDPQAIRENNRIFTERMDQLEAIHGKCTQDNSYKFQSALDDLEVELSTKFPSVMEIVMPRSKKQWSDLIKSYGAVAVLNVNDKVTIMILDDNKG